MTDNATDKIVFDAESFRIVKKYLPAWNRNDYRRADSLACKTYTGPNEERASARRALIDEFGRALVSGAAEAISSLFPELKDYAWEGFFETLAARKADPQRACELPFLKDAAVTIYLRTYRFMLDDIPREDLRNAEHLQGSALDAVAVRAKFIDSNKTNGPRSVLAIAMNELMNITALKLANKLGNPGLAEDAAQTGWEKLYGCILDKWDPTKSQFGTYAGKAVYNEMKRAMDMMQVVPTTQGVRLRRKESGMETFTDRDWGLSIINDPDGTEEGPFVNGSLLADEDQDTELVALTNASNAQAEEFRRTITEGFFNKPNVSAPLRRLLLASGVIDSEMSEVTVKNVAKSEKMTPRAIQMSIKKIKDIIKDEIIPAPDRFIPMNQEQADALTAFLILRHYRELTQL